MKPTTAAIQGAGVTRRPVARPSNGSELLAAAVIVAVGVFVLLLTTAL